MSSAYTRHTSSCKQGPGYSRTFGPYFDDSLFLGEDGVFRCLGSLHARAKNQSRSCSVASDCVASCLPTLFHDHPVASVLPGVEDQAVESELAVSPDSVETRHVEVDIPSLLAGTYVVSILKKGRFKRLHRIGECSLVPGVDYRAFEVLGFDEPCASSYSARCRNCFA